MKSSTRFWLVFLATCLLLGLGLILWKVSRLEKLIPEALAAKQVKSIVNKKEIHLLELVNNPSYKDPPSHQNPYNRLVERIVACESGGRADAKNPNSSAKGIFQFLDGTWAYYSVKHWGDTSRSVWNEAANRELGEWVIATHGTNDWLASKWCWNS